MAKKVRMDSSSLLKDIQVQSLMNTPEAFKLELLDKEITNIVSDRKLKTYEKITKYEEALARFKNIQNKIIKDGGYNLINKPQREFVDALKIALEEVMIHPQNPIDNTGLYNDGSILGGVSNAAVYSPSHTYSNMSGISDRDAGDGDDDDDSYIAERGRPKQKMRRYDYYRRRTDPVSIPSLKFTPASPNQQNDIQSDNPLEIELSTNTKSTKKPTPRNKAKYGKETIENFLQAEGVTRDNDGKIDFKILDKENLKNTKFTESYYHKVLNYLTSSREKQKPQKSDNLIKLIYTNLIDKNKKDLKKMMKYMPNLKNTDLEYNKALSPVRQWEKI